MSRPYNLYEADVSVYAQGGRLPHGGRGEGQGRRPRLRHRQTATTESGTLLHVHSCNYIGIHGRKVQI